MIVSKEKKENEKESIKAVDIRTAFWKEEDRRIH
jgi:hypothetical protein